MGPCAGIGVIVDQPAIAVSRSANSVADLKPSVGRFPEAGIAKASRRLALLQFRDGRPKERSLPLDPFRMGGDPSLRDAVAEGIIVVVERHVYGSIFRTNSDANRAVIAVLLENVVRKTDATPLTRGKLSPGQTEPSLGIVIAHILVLPVRHHGILLLMHGVDAYAAEIRVHALGCEGCGIDHAVTRLGDCEVCPARARHAHE